MHTEKAQPTSRAPHYPSRHKLTSRVHHVPLSVDEVSLGVVSDLDRAVDVHCSTAAARLLRGRCVVVLVLLLVMLLERRTTAARAGHAAGGRRRLRLLLCAARPATPQALQFSLGGRCGTAGERRDWSLHRRRSATGVGSFTYAHSQHGGQFAAVFIKVRWFEIQ